MKKNYFCLLVLLLASCKTNRPISSSSSSSFIDCVPSEITFQDFSYEEIKGSYETVGICPNSPLSYAPTYTDETFTLKYHGVNRSRGEGEVIIYYGRSSSNCNAWGYEVAVNKDGYVVEIQSLVHIPDGGFAVSAHGEKNIDFITKNFQLGQKVSYANGNIEVIDNFYERRAFEMELSATQFDSSYKQALDNLENIDFSAKDDIATLCNCSIQATKSLQTYHIDKSEDNLKSFMGFSNHFTNLATISEKKLYPSRVVEARGVWHRPNERSLPAIQKFLQLIKSANMNIIFLETNDDVGLTYTDPKYPLSPVLNNEYTGYADYLSAFIGEAHKLGIEVHAWDKVFFVLKEIYNDHPNWQMLFYNNGNYKTNMDQFGLTFFDPGIEEVKQYTVQRINNLLKKYDFDGYQFDYIRYPTGNADISTSSGYSAEAIAKFGATPNSENYTQWSQFRMQQITETVRRSVEMIRKNHPKIKTSIAVVSDVDSARRNNLQDWQTWVENNYIDIVDLMAYHYDTSYVKKDTIALKNISKKKTFNYTGLSPTYLSIPDIENSAQIKATNQAGAHGSIIFAGHNIVNRPSVATLLRQSVYRFDNVLPHQSLRKVLNAGFSEILYKYENIYIPNNAASQEQLSSLKDVFISILSFTMNTKTEMENIKSLLNHIDCKIYGNDIVKLRLKEDITYLEDIVQIQINQNRNQ